MRSLASTTPAKVFGGAAAQLPVFALSRASSQGPARARKGRSILETDDPGYLADVLKPFNPLGNLSIAPIALLVGGHHGSDVPIALPLARLSFVLPRVAR